MYIMIIVVKQALVHSGVQKCFTVSQELASNVQKCMSSGQSVTFQRVYNFPYEEDGAGILIHNFQEKGPIEFDSRWTGKIARSPGDLLHCGSRCFSAILMNT